MKFNYNLYRPKKFIQDVRKINNSYFKTKDINVTPLTKIGDADKLYREQFEGRIPALAKKLKPNQLTLRTVLSRRSVPVRNAGRSKKIGVRVLNPGWRKTLQTKLPVSVSAPSTFKRIVQLLTTRVARMPMGPLVVVLLIIGGSAGFGSYQIASSSDRQSQESLQQKSADTEDKRQTASQLSKKKQTPSNTNTPAAATSPPPNASSEGAREGRQNNTNNSIARPAPRTLPLPKNQHETPTAPSTQASPAPSTQIPPITSQPPAVSPPQEPDSSPPTTQPQQTPAVTEDGTPEAPAPSDQSTTEAPFSLSDSFDIINTLNRYPESTNERTTQPQNTPALNHSE